MSEIPWELSEIEEDTAPRLEPGESYLPVLISCGLVFLGFIILFF